MTEGLATSCVFWTFVALVAAALIHALLSRYLGRIDDHRLKERLEALPLPEVYVPRCRRCNDEWWVCPAGSDPVPCECNPGGLPPPTDEEDLEALLEQAEEVVDREDQRAWAERSLDRLRRWFGQEDRIP